MAGSLNLISFILAGFSFLIMAIYTFVIFKGTGFKNLFIIFKTKFKRRKGWGLIKILHKTGYPELIPTIFNEETFKPYGKDGGIYIFKSYCLYYNEFDIPTIDYRMGDANPIDYRTGLQTTTHSKVLSNTITRAVKAEALVGSELEDWIKKNWKTLGLGFLVVVGGLIFIIMNQNDTIASCIVQGSKSAIINVTSLGK